MENIMLLILGVFISVMGIVNIKGNISTIHSYNRRKVKEEDVPKYGKAVGTGTLIIGISLVLGFIVALPPPMLGNVSTNGFNQVFQFKNVLKNSENSKFPLLKKSLYCI